MSSLQKEVGEVTMKLTNELSLESTNVQICKARINELEHNKQKYKQSHILIGDFYEWWNVLLAFI
jgi:hypothetical protein